ncbi:hypothetical protein FRC03_002776, partial [Tulasnella sp. 419]
AKAVLQQQTRHISRQVIKSNSILHAGVWHKILTTLIEYNAVYTLGLPYFGAQVDKRGEVASPDAFNLGPLPAPQTSYARSIARKPPKHILEHVPHPPANQTRRVASVIEGL